MGIHDGHRKHIRQRFLDYGLDTFEDHNVLELLLFYGIPRKDTNELAHKLLDAFGSLNAVFDASPEALMAVPGVGESIAALIRLVPEIMRRSEMTKRPEKFLLTSKEAGDYVLPLFLTCREEVAYLVCMDAKMKVIDCRQISHGTATAVSLNTRQIIQIALGQNASSVLLAHNHTGGIALPSTDDVNVTIHLRKVLAKIGVTLVDHLVVADGDFVSMADSGYLPQE